MKLSAAPIAGLVAVTALGCAGVYFYGHSFGGDVTEASGEVGYAIVAGSLSTAPASDKVNFDSQGAAITAFQKNGDNSLAKKYIDDLREVVLRGKGAYFLSTLVNYFPKFGLSRAERDSFMSSLPMPVDRDLRSIYLGWKNEIKLRKMPLDYSFTTIDGEEFDVASLRGKVVLLDFWDTGCSGCIEAMPRIQQAYQNYRGQDFEVVSVAFEDTAGNIDTKAIGRIKKETGATWPYSLAAPKQWSKLAAIFGYSGRPQYMLLDREGRLIAATGEVDLAKNLETLLKANL